MPSATLQALSASTTVEPDSGVLASIESSVDSVFSDIARELSEVIFYSVSIAGATFPLIVGWLVLAGLIFTVYFGFIQFRGLKVAVETIRGRFSRNSDPGEVTHFQALTSAVSGTVGLGNIAGVAVAVTVGGPGATFWMIIAGLLGMCTKFVECTLGVKYREVHEDGSVTGGPFRYLKVAFAKLKVTWVGTILTAVFAIAIFFFGVAGGNMFQANQTFAQIRNVTGGDDGFLGSDGAAFVFGVVLAALVGAVILGGISSIGRVTSRLVPAMAILYVIACLIVIIGNIGQVPEAVGAILSNAFNPEGVAGGVLGALIVGFQRAAFSNEAGLGSAPIAHSAVKTHRPVSEGFVALLEPFVDTVIICTMTALTIIIASPQSWLDARAEVAATGSSSADGVVLTSDAFESVISWFPIVLAIAVTLFAFSTLITWSYYSEKAWAHFFGRSSASLLTFKVIYCAFTVIGTVLTFGSVLTLADAMLFLCALVNIIGLYILAPVVKDELRSYLADRRSGKLAREGQDVPTA
ncbi:alanine:cation symporter family protein [Paenibacillus sp. TRM 82003]|uniref:alanine/glycine:cation symporter family protein n=1 Tax=Kineococcus sp. TRM81007 TaxID=2925831 RepID=UPI001F59AB10|nr:alanine/glycine:cation symporter family protein [Kineococcus sp. TRM81007]MCI2239513.1 alanine:cation symporter family protein [Kineococcus sp. TRM81007]MCI3926206.1 alanine:cation symporter family protein [Paenibacillus sp. TRM 82003]